MDHERTSVMGYMTLIEWSGINLSNSPLQITHDMYINGNFMLLFHLITDRCASESHTSHADQGNIRVELKFGKPITRGNHVPALPRICQFRPHRFFMQPH